MKPLLKFSAVALVGAAAFASAGLLVPDFTVLLGGSGYTVASVKVNGRVYVDAQQLVAKYNANPPRAAGGAGQIAATEGAMGEWLFNGVWRFRVDKVEWNADDEYWMVGIEMRNGTKTTRHVGGQGLPGIPSEAFHLATEGGDTLSITSTAYINELQDTLGYKELAAGMGTKTVMPFSRGKRGDRPTKLVVEFTPVAGQGYVKDPSFRVDLTRTKG